jgi:hypothetical protein
LEHGGSALSPLGVAAGVGAAYSAAPSEDRMSRYTVVAGDNLWRIARRHRVRRWRNIYFATENNRFRIRRPSPHAIRPGDVIEIPSRESIAPMERRPVVRHRDLPLFTQSAETCWRTTGKMLWLRRHAGATEAQFDATIGARYRTQESGLDFAYWHDFYVRVLGLSATRIESFNDLHRALALHGPVIAVVGSGDTAHSMIIAGYDLDAGTWLLVDPLGGREQLVFEGMDVMADDGGGGNVTEFRAGPATWEAMARSVGIGEHTVNQWLFHD